MPADQYPLLVAGTTFYFYHIRFNLDGYRVYAIPYAFALIGLLAAAALRTDALASLLRKDISAIHRESFRQIRYVMALLFVYFLTADPSLPLLGPRFVVGFFALSYLLLLLTHWRLPAVITKYAFSGARVERTLIVGTPEKVADLGLYLAHKEDIGIKTIGIVCDGIPRGHLWKISRLGRAVGFKALAEDAQYHAGDRGRVSHFQEPARVHHRYLPGAGRAAARGQHAALDVHSQGLHVCGRRP